jgi:alpha-D-ribose 1-methylphosphonate 5-triphosphate synthase subunit PhnL
MTATPVLEVRGLSKRFTVHLQGGVRVEALQSVDLDVRQGECVALVGPSGAGKSTLIKCVYGNYVPSEGSIRIRHDGAMVELTSAAPHQALLIRRDSIGYVSQFLRVIPRVPTLDIVVEAALAGTRAPTPVIRAAAVDAAERMLERLALPRRQWTLPPATFSGGEQQRVNIAHALVRPRPLLLLDEPTASLDRDNRDRVIDLLRAERARGVAMLGIFHDEEVRARLATRTLAIRDLAKETL